VAKRTKEPPDSLDAQLVIITGLSGSGKATVLKAFEDIGYYAVDNLPIGLIQNSANSPRMLQLSAAPPW